MYWNPSVASYQTDIESCDQKSTVSGTLSLIVVINDIRHKKIPPLSLINDRFNLKINWISSCSLIIWILSIFLFVEPLLQHIRKEKILSIADTVNNVYKGEIIYVMS